MNSHGGAYQLTDLATRPEDQWFDRKSARIEARDLAKTLVAFANAEGGLVAVGIKDDGTIEGELTAEQENRLRVAAHTFTDPAVRLKISNCESVLLFEVEPGERVHFTTDGKCYLRLGDKSVKLNLDQQQELRYSKGEQLYDATGLGRTSLDDLDMDRVAEFAQHIGSTTPVDALRARGLVNRNGEVTVAGMLLFGKYPQEFLPNSEIRVLKYLDDDRASGSRQQLEVDQRFEGPLPTQLSEAADFIRTVLPAVKRLGADGLFETQSRIPDDAWLEGLVNAVIHRSYSMMGDHIRVEIYPSRIEISSPGRFPGLADPREPEKIARFARNPHIARVMTDLGIGQELGEGIRRIFAEIRRVGFLDPQYVQTNGSVILVLRAIQRIDQTELVGLPRETDAVLALLQQESGGLGTGEIAERIGVSRPKARNILGQMKDAKLLDWLGASPRDPRARWVLRPPLT